ncbi:hypothetical protein BS17DRAFT_817144 [Gyrodon lividus]|nr:hypothetical protein BS17DRAFT_817144 [Gyrodon lividus]
MQRRKREEVASLRAGKKKVQTQSPVAEDKEDKKDEDEEWVKGEDNRDMLGVLTEVLTAMVAEMHNMAVDWRCMAAESCTQMEQMLGTLEEIQGCLDPDFAPEELQAGSEEEYKEVVEQEV